MVIVVRIDLDRYEIEMIERLVVDGVVTLQEARECRAVKELGDWQSVLWVRKMQPKVHTYAQQMQGILDLYVEMASGKKVG